MPTFLIFIRADAILLLILLALLARDKPKPKRRQRIAGPILVKMAPLVDWP